MNFERSSEEEESDANYPESSDDDEETAFDPDRGPNKKTKELYSTAPAPEVRFSKLNPFYLFTNSLHSHPFHLVGAIENALQAPKEVLYWLKKQ